MKWTHGSLADLLAKEKKPVTCSPGLRTYGAVLMWNKVTRRNHQLTLTLLSHLWFAPTWLGSERPCTSDFTHALQEQKFWEFGGRKKSSMRRLHSKARHRRWLSNLLNSGIPSNVLKRGFTVGDVVVGGPTSPRQHIQPIRWRFPRASWRDNQ